MIKRNESDVGHVVLEILAKTVFNRDCSNSIDKSFITLQPYIHFGNGVCIKMKHFKMMRKWCKKIEIEIFRQVTHSPYCTGHNGKNNASTSVSVDKKILFMSQYIDNDL